MKKDKQIVAMTYKVCPVCGKKDEEQSEILLSKNLNRDISELNGKCTGFGNPCKECQEMMEMGIVVVIYNEDKTTQEDAKKGNFYRTGNIAVLNVEAVERMLNGYPDLKNILEKRVLLLGDKAAEEMGLMESFRSHQN